ncbi:MAG: hypothetical protein RML49_05685 [Verrucomicrobiae bacterium]|nr:hypothetical protein [Verrucomicrobiae bacterium]
MLIQAAHRLALLPHLLRVHLAVSPAQVLMLHLRRAFHSLSHLGIVVHRPSQAHQVHLYHRVSPRSVRVLPQVYQAQIVHLVLAQAAVTHPTVVPLAAVLHQIIQVH